MLCSCVCGDIRGLDLLQSWKNFCVMRVFCVECLISSNIHLSLCGMMCCGVWVWWYDLDWLLCELLWLLLLYLWLQEWDLNLLDLCLARWSWWWCLSQWILWDVDLLWCLVRTGIFVPCQCTWQGDFVRAICCDMARLITIKTFYTRAMACHVSWFLTLEAFVIITWHDIHGGWR